MQAKYNQSNCRMLLQLLVQLQGAVVADPVKARLGGLVAHLLPCLESIAYFMSVFSAWCASWPGLGRKLLG